jgi:hypothetical protein
MILILDCDIASTLAKIGRLDLLKRISNNIAQKDLIKDCPRFLIQTFGFLAFLPRFRLISMFIPPFSRFFSTATAIPHSCS